RDDLVRALGDGDDGGRQRRGDDQDHQERHDGNREAPLAPEPSLQGAQRGPGGHDDRRGPDAREQKRPEHPEAQERQAADRQDAEDDPREVPAAWRCGRRVHGPPLRRQNTTCSSRLSSSFSGIMVRASGATGTRVITASWTTASLVTGLGRMLRTISKLLPRSARDWPAAERLWNPVTSVMARSPRGSAGCLAAALGAKVWAAVVAAERS